MEDGTQREDITAGLDVFRLGEFDYLWSNIPWGPASEEKILILIGMSGKTKINNNRFKGVPAQHDILRF